MITTPYRISAFVFILLVATTGLAQAQVVVQQAPQIVIVKPNPVAAITGALLAPVTQTPNPQNIQSNNGAIPSNGPVSYPSASGACQPGYVFDGHGYCIVPYNSPNNAAPAASAPTLYAAQPCQPGYVPDGRGACVPPYPAPNTAAPPTTGTTPPAPVACMTGYVLDGQGSCVPLNTLQNDAPPPPAAPAATNTSADCPAGYALDHDGNCSFSSETNPYQK